MLPSNYEEDKNKVPMNKTYNIQNTNICNGIFHISFFRALLINEGEATRGVNGIRGETTRYHCTGIYQPKFGIHFLLYIPCIYIFCNCWSWINRMWDRFIIVLILRWYAIPKHFLIQIHAFIKVNMPQPSALTCNDL